MAKLGDVCSVITDGSHFSPKDIGTGYPMMSVKDMNEKGFSFESCKHISAEDYQILLKNGCKPKQGDVLLAKDGSYFKYSFVVEQEQELVVLSSIAILRPKTEVVDPKYLREFLMADSTYETVSLNYISGTALKRVILQGIKKIDIPLPTLEKQRQIAAKFNEVDHLISLRKQQLAKLDELVKARFVEMFGDTVLNQFGWEKALLGTVCDVRDGTHDSPQYYETGYPLVTSKNVTGGSIDLKDCSMICETDFIKINERSKVDMGDIIMPMIGTVGKPVIVDIEPNFAIKNVSLIKFKSDSMVLNIYIRALLQSDYFDDAVLSKVRGGTQKFISLGDIRKLEILVPPMELQKNFAIFVEQTDKSKLAIQQALDKLETLKKTLMQKYFG